MQRLGKNAGGYFGEVIDIHQVLQKIEQAAMRGNFVRDPEFLAYRRVANPSRARLYISAGIHGDEPAGPMSVLRLLEENRWPGDVSVSICPCLNITGFEIHKRENVNGLDLNRDYRHFQSTECRAHADWLLKQEPFDVSLSLHEDWESNGFYLYELNPDNKPSFAEKILEEVAKVCPVDQGAIIENWPAQNGLIRPNLNPEDRPQWPEAVYLIIHKSRRSYTLEAPSDFTLETRVEALRAAVLGVLAVL